MRPITADDINLVDTSSDELVADGVGVEPASSTPDYRAALFVNSFHTFWIEFHPVVGVESSVSVFRTPYRSDTIVEPQCHNNLSDHHIQSGTQPTTGDHTGSYFLRVEEYLLSGPSLHKS